ncbi:MAG: AAA family ATPase [Bradymonadales bacterium]|nr:AAA family ATPase [Bradymonadales bacterium]
MARIRINSFNAHLGYEIARRLEEAGHTIVQVHTVPVESGRLIHCPGLPLAGVLGILTAISPFQVTSSQVGEVGEGVDLELSLGEQEPLGQWNVRLHVDSQRLGQQLSASLSAAGFDVKGVIHEFLHRSVVVYGGASPFARQLIRFLLGEQKVVPLERKEWEEFDDDIWIYARDPEIEGDLPRERFRLVIRTDDVPGIAPLVAVLERLGFRCAVEEMKAIRRKAAFRFEPGPFSGKEGLCEQEEIRNVTLSFLTGCGVSSEDYPLLEPAHAGGEHSFEHLLGIRPDPDPRWEPPFFGGEQPAEQCDGTFAGRERPLEALLELPLREWREGTMKSYGGGAPGRYEVILSTDDSRRARAFADALEAEGFDPVQLRGLVSRCGGIGMRVDGDPEALAQVAGRVREVAARCGLAPELGDTAGFPVIPGDAKGRTLIIELPFAALRPDGAEKLLSEAGSRFSLTVFREVEDDLSDLMESLVPLNFRRAKVRDGNGCLDLCIAYGGASPALVWAVADRVRRCFGEEPRLAKEWHDNDRDVWVHLPEALGRPAAVTRRSRSDRDSTGRRTAGRKVVQVDRAFLDTSRPGLLLVGEVELERCAEEGSMLVPPAGEFDRYCLDAPTAQTLVHLARCVKLAEPCLLEGVTGTSKTSCVRYLAYLLGQPVVRVNLNGQTDTGELIGKFIPAESVECRDHPGHSWRWQDGLVVQALRQGWWVILDEVNLAEPQILERLNSLLEDKPSLVVTEHENEMYGARGFPIHPRFRIFATMNPLGYAGRSPLSPSWLNRWRGYRLVTPPDEADCLALLRRLAQGVQDGVAVDGVRYAAQADQSRATPLAAMPGIEPILERVARFHVSAVKGFESNGTGSDPIGATGCYPYLFTRRNLLSLINYLEAEVPSQRCVDLLAKVHDGLVRYYLDLVTGSEGDRKAMLRLIDATGLTAVPECSSQRPKSKGSKRKGRGRRAASSGRPTGSGKEEAENGERAAEDAHPVAGGAELAGGSGKPEEEIEQRAAEDGHPVAGGAQLADSTAISTARHRWSVEDLVEPEEPGQTMAVPMTDKDRERAKKAMQMLLVAMTDATKDCDSQEDPP